jgi:hypothetical protein
MYALANIADVNAHPPLPSSCEPQTFIEVPFVMEPDKGTLHPNSALMDILDGVDCRRIRRCLICPKTMLGRSPQQGVLY